MTTQVSLAVKCMFVICFQHSCDPNVFVQNVFVDSHDIRFPWVAFFTGRSVQYGTCNSNLISVVNRTSQWLHCATSCVSVSVVTVHQGLLSFREVGALSGLVTSARGHSKAQQTLASSSLLSQAEWRTRSVNAIIYCLF